jgi:uroporphyrinogen-III decarboxylase
MYGTPADVEEEVKRSIDLLAPGSGYIMSNTVALDFVSPENMHAWRDAVEKYGKY